jgi:hypothetical protein
MGYNQVSVDDTVTPTFTISSDQASGGEIKNLGPADVYIGTDSDVTSATGYPLAPGERISVDEFENNSGSEEYVYAVTAAGSATVSYIQWSV